MLRLLKMLSCALVVLCVVLVAVGHLTRPITKNVAKGACWYTTTHTDGSSREYLADASCRDLDQILTKDGGIYILTNAYQAEIGNGLSREGHLSSRFISREDPESDEAQVWDAAFRKVKEDHEHQSVASDARRLIKSFF